MSLFVYLFRCTNDIFFTFISDHMYANVLKYIKYVFYFPKCYIILPVNFVIQYIRLKLPFASVFQSVFRLA